ncbi:RluA family pseudouridine synthase [Streptomyces carminius]|uniref:RluA family pseudouridine synthase n=1 Tax=Streptomyces carminius TaxID=2665496 RepID=UPI001E2EAA2A|nr:RluA family pseudouridine synthase [Streptomyces carminius]
MSRWSEIRDGAALYEDEAILVLNKPAGISVMGERHETDLVRLAEEEGETLYPVHRIDKVTSGAVLFAKEVRFHSVLTRQFNRRTVDKSYLAVTRSTGLPQAGTIDLPLGVGRKNRVRVAGNRGDIVADEKDGGDGRDGEEVRWSLAPGAGFGEKRSYPSLTVFARVGDDGRHTVLAVRPVTGRRHQIRVHLAWTGHAIEGDPLFDRESAAAGARTCLHSWWLAFDAPWAGSGTRLEFQAPPDADFWAPLGGDLAGGPAADELDRAHRLLAERAAAEADRWDGTGA